MAINAFLKLSDIPGESVDETHPDEIEVVSYSFGASNVAGGGGAAGAGRVAFTDLNVTVPQSRATPLLLQRVSDGRPLTEAVLSVARRTSVEDSTTDFWTVRLTEVYVTSVNEAFTEDVRPLDAFSLSFATIQWSYRQLDGKGGFDKAVEGGWNLSENRPA